MNKLVIASNNQGKLHELQAMLASLGIEVLTQAQLGISEAEEPHPTFVENALAKARHASAASGLPALADDSGICVAALNGAPGVLSARYASGLYAEQKNNDHSNNEKLLRDMQGVTDRRAHYYCVLALVCSASDPQPIIAEGEWHGEIAMQARGKGGFGYDPIFWLPELGKTSAELTRDEKVQISHRALALKILLGRLNAKLKNG
ncbi:MAG: RdgB/HAM1 family non-canonical purine NTP pyrophosphatase [Candidatus Nitrotoga sp.]